LNVDDVTSGLALLSGLGDTICPGWMIGTGFDDLGSNCFAQSGDTIVISCYHQLIQFSAERCTFKNVLEEWFSEERMKGFSGEARGGPAGRDDANDSYFFVVYNTPP
jgi:hypothetical protein